MGHQSLSERFWSKVEKRGADDCWVWTGGRQTVGYGRINVKGRYFGAHRVAYELTNGPIPDGVGHHGACVLHSCDNRLCVNPAHLSVGSHAENMADRDAKNRQRGVSQPGAKNPNARLSAEAAQTIRFLRRSTLLTAPVVAKLFGVTRQTVHRVVTRQAWADVPDLALGACA